MARTYTEVEVQQPRLVRELFNTDRLAWLWAILRVYIGWQWLTSGWGKLGAEAWQTGAALQGFMARAIAIPEAGRPAISYDWYRSFLTFMVEGGHASWFSPVIVWGEILVGAALILGLFTGIAAFGGALMNFNFMLAGSASTNPVLFIIAVLLMMGWKVAGSWGLDRFLLPTVGTPWSKVAVKEGKRIAVEPIPPRI